MAHIQPYDECVGDVEGLIIEEVALMAVQILLLLVTFAFFLPLGFSVLMTWFSWKPSSSTH